MSVLDVRLAKAQAEIKQLQQLIRDAQETEQEVPKPDSVIFVAHQRVVLNH